MIKRKMNLKIWFFIHILVIVPWLFGSVMQAGAQIQKTITGEDSLVVDPKAVQAAVAEAGTIDLKETFDFGEEGSVTITEDVNIAGKASSITITASASPKAGGSISPSGRIAVGNGEDLQFTITPNTGYQIKDVIVDGVSKGAVNIYTFTNIAKKHSIKTKFTKQTFTVTIAQGGNVSVSPVGTKKAPYGKKIKLKITPNSEDVLPILLVNGQQVDATKSGKIYEFDFTAVGNTSVYATSAVEPTIAPNVKIMDEATAQNLSSISADGSVLTFNGVTSYLQSLQPNDVIMSGVTKATPYGLLRKVTNITIDGSKITVETTEATLEDLIEEGEIIIGKALTASDITSFVPLVEGVSLQEETIPGQLGLQKCISLHNVLYDFDGNSTTTDDQIVVNGSACLEPTFHFALGIKMQWLPPKPKLKNLVFSAGISESIDLELDSQCTVSFSKEDPVATIGFAPITVGPLIFYPELTVYVGIDGSVSGGITAGVTQNAGLTVGVSYHDGNWAPIADFTSSFAFNLSPVSAGAQVQVYVRPEFDFLLYGIAGPYAHLRGYFDLEMAPLSNPWLTLYGGISGGAGVKVKVLGKELVDYKIDPLFDYWQVLAELFGNQPPTITSLGASPTRVFTGRTSTVTVVASDPENDPVTCSWSTDGGTLSSTTWCGSVTWTAPDTPGTYTISVSVTDNKEGHDPMTRGVTIDVLPLPPHYTLTVQKSGTGSGTVTGPGIDCGDDCSESYESGTLVSLTATPSSGSAFTSWSGCDSTNGSSCRVTNNQNKTVIATFTLSYTLTVQKSGTGSGTVTGTGINCGSDCSESYASGTQVTLTAAPSSGSTFTSWSGCDSTNGNTCSVTINQSKTVIATFSAIPHTLTVNKTGTGSGTVSGTGINCGSDCSESYMSGTSVTLTATPSSGSSFTSWSGCDSTNGNTCSVTMNQDKTVIATFTLGYTLTVQKAGTGNGTVTGTGINCGSDCSESYASGTQVTLTAAPSNGSSFTSWSGCDSMNGNTCNVTMNQNKTVIATFTAQTFIISGYVTTCGTFPHSPSPISGVVMSGLPGSPITNSQGYYSATVPYGWSGIVNPTIPGQPSHVFGSKTYNNVISNQTDQNYIDASTCI